MTNKLYFNFTFLYFYFICHSSAQRTAFTQHRHIVLSSRVSQPNSLSLWTQNNLLIPGGSRVNLLCTASHASIYFLKCGYLSCTQHCRCGLHKLLYNWSKTPFFIYSNSLAIKPNMPFTFVIASMNNPDCAPNSPQHFKSVTFQPLLSSEEESQTLKALILFLSR